jgi:NADPH-dependent 2,4-dienoyl-CoA reductase/sulfur reductase-like enzyme
LEAANHGARVTVIDENDRPGGQLFKQIHKFFVSARHQAGIRGIEIGNALLKQTDAAGVDILLRTVAVGLFDGRIAAVRNDEELLEFRPGKTIIATGATENPFIFPGWTLPGIMTAGAAQTFINIHRVPVGKKVIMVGSGNVGLIVAFQLIQAGSEVVAVVEARDKIGGWGVHASKLRRTGCLIHTATTVMRADGPDRVARVLLQKVATDLAPIPGTEMEVEADTVCLGVGLSPRTELVQMGACS